MPAPSKNFTTIADSSVDGSSPGTSALVTALRDNAIHDRECIYDPALHTASKAHDHDGADSAKVKDANLDRTGGLHIFDDFLFDNISGLWTDNPTHPSFISASTNGIARIPNVGSLSSSVGRPWKLGGGNTITFEARAKYPSNITSGGIVGLSDNTNFASVISGIFFGTWANKWWTYTYDTTNTPANTAVAITGGWFKLKFVATAASVTFYIDDVLKTTHTTNIPTGNMGVVLSSPIDWLDVDYVDCAASARM